MNCPDERVVNPLAAAILATLVVIAAQSPVGGQAVYLTGQNIAPVFEGWQPNQDGTIDLVFGYFNRNLDEELDIPIGPNNSLEPGGPDQGQPTHFRPNRNKFVFNVAVPKDFGKNELVWTITANGKTERAYATLKPDYIINKAIVMRGYAGFFGTNPAELANEPPTLDVEGDPRRTVKVGETLELMTIVRDQDEIPKASPSPAKLGRVSALGLRVSCFVYRGAGKVRFDPEQFREYQDTRTDSPWAPGWRPPPIPPDGRVQVAATFATPGEFVLRVMAHDGALATTRDISVSVVR
jgi:hypothetical protein